MASDVVSFGETMLRLSPPSGVRLEEASTLHVYVAGTESNTLACLSRLHLRTIWVSALPLTPLGKHVESELRRHGVNTEHVVWMGSNTRLGIFYAEEAPNPLGLQVYYDRAHSTCALIDPEAVDLSVVDSARMLHLTGITPALSDRAREVFTRFLHRARQKSIPLSFDVNYRTKLWSVHEAAASLEEACQQADVLFCTHADAAELWGFTGSAESVLRQMAGRFAAHTTSKTLVLTLGSEGSAQLQDDIYSTEPAFPTEGTARFGSGDAFAAGYLYAHLEGELYREMCEERRENGEPGVTALTFGNALAALKRCIAGDIASITPQEMRALLQKQEGNSRFR
jgi:2-dehydro-3-deoxygluconokinase